MAFELSTAKFAAAALTLAMLLLPANPAHASEDFWALADKGELGGKPEVAYAHWLATIESNEPTVFCHVGELPCGDAGERGATEQQLAEVRDVIAAVRGQMFFTDVEFLTSEVQANQAILHYAARGNGGEPVSGTVKMQRQNGEYWRIVEQAWVPDAKH